MPTYDYVCKNCEHEWEFFQSIKANPIRKCPSCGKLRAKRIIGPGAGIIFKGSGFYQTAYRSDFYTGPGHLAVLTLWGGPTAAVMENFVAPHHP